jgi:hypothetical protein
MRLVKMALAGLLLAALVVGCGGDAGKGSSGSRPSTTARLAIVAPTANEVTSSDITVKLELQGAKVVDRTSGKLSATEGHIHLSLDGQLVSMAFGTSQDLHSITPGQHTLQAEFVAVDHQPFANRVVAAVIFQVQA